MDGIWFNYEENDFFTDLYQDIYEDLEDPAIYEAEKDFQNLDSPKWNDYIIANIVALILALICLTGVFLGPRGMAYGVFAMKAVFLALTSAVLISYPSIKQALTNTADVSNLPNSVDNFSFGTVYPQLITVTAFFSIMVFNDCLGVFFCYELFLCVCKLETRTKTLKSILQKSAAASVIHAIVFGVFMMLADKIGSKASSLASATRMLSHSNFRVPWTGFVFVYTTYLAFCISFSLIKTMFFQSRNGKRFNYKSIFLIVLVITMAFCAFLQTVPYVMNIIIIWYYGDAEHVKECFQIMADKKEIPFECLVAGDDQEMFEGTLSVYSQFPALLLHATKNYLAVVKSLLSQ